MGQESKSINEYWKDPSQDFIYSYPHPLDPLFEPRTIALVGAKDDVGSVGRTILQNLLSGGSKATIYPVNPKRELVLGLRCYSSINLVPVEIDLAIVVIPAPGVPQVIRECVQKGCKTAIVISAGFKELGIDGLRLEQEMLIEAKKGALRIIGPNCLGVMNPHYGLNATFAKGIALPGSIAFISQSGAMCTAVLDWSFQERIGFSSFVSIGSMADIDWGDLIGYLGRDANTKSILIYMETVGNPRSFLSAAREVALDKPIIVIKPGKSAEAAKAAASHTGSLAGADDVFEAALERVGVLRVDTISELFSMANVLATQPRPRGPRLAIITNAGGPSVLATDATIKAGAELAQLSEETIRSCNQFLPSAWSHSNPVDILGDASAVRYEKSLEVVSADSAVDGLLVILSPQDMTDSNGTADSLRRFSGTLKKPLLASWMGGAFVKKGIEMLSQVGIPTFMYPDDAATSFATMWRYQKLLRQLYETPKGDLKQEQYVSQSITTENVSQLLLLEQKEKESTLSETSSKEILRAYGIPTIETVIAKTAKEASTIAQQIGFPVVVKLHSTQITHKSDVGGVKLNLNSCQEVEEAFQTIEQTIEMKFGRNAFEGVAVQEMVKEKQFELIVGASCDPQFGPVVLFGAGGVFVEVFKDKALALPPLTKTLAALTIDKTKISRAFKGFRGADPIDVDELQAILVRFSEFIAEQPLVKEVDINPLVITSSGYKALDARIVLYGKNEKITPLALRPYPREYITSGKLKNGVPFTIRPIRPEDEPKIVEFHKELSEKSVRQRYFSFVSLDKRTAHERLLRICTSDFDKEIALVGEVQGAIAGVVRLTRVTATTSDIKLIVQDNVQQMGLGRALLEYALFVAKKEGVKVVVATVLEENYGMLKLAKKYNFEVVEKRGELLVIRRSIGS